MTTVDETDATTPAADAAPAKRKRGRPRKDEAAATPELDLSSLTVQAGVEMPKAERAKADNPFVQHLGESWENEDARAVTVPAANVSRIESLIRRAADVLTEANPTTPVGVTIHKSDEVDGMVTVTFAAKDRRKRTAKEVAADEAAATETPAE